MKRFLLILLASMLACVAFGQQPQASDVSGTQPIYRTNAAYVQGVGPGYWPTAGTGLTLNLTAGTAVCSGTVITYAGGTLTLTASSTNYVYLNPASSCVPAFNTTGFGAGAIPIATVTTGGSSITGITDLRTMFSYGSSLPKASDAIQYVSTNGSDSNDGLSWGTAKATVSGACAALPGGNSSCSAGYGSIYISPDYAGSVPSAVTGSIFLSFLSGGMGLLTNTQNQGPAYRQFSLKASLPAAASYPTNNFVNPFVLEMWCGTYNGGSLVGKNSIGMYVSSAAAGAGCVQPMGSAAFSFTTSQALTGFGPYRVVESDFGNNGGENAADGGASYGSPANNSDWENQNFLAVCTGSNLCGAAFVVKSNNAPAGDFVNGIIVTDYTDAAVKIIRNGASDGSNGIIFDTNGASLGNCILWNSNGAANPRWQICKDSSDGFYIYDSVTSMDRFNAFPGANGNTQISAPGTGAVLATSSGQTGAVVIGHYYGGTNPQMLSSAYTNATTSFTAVGIGSWYAPSNASVSASCHLYYQAASTGGLNIEFTGPASPTAVSYGVTIPVSSSSVYAGASSGYSTSLGSAVSTAATTFDAIVSFGLVNGANAGTVALYAKSSAAAALTIEPGSYCSIM